MTLTDADIERDIRERDACYAPLPPHILPDSHEMAYIDRRTLLRNIEAQQAKIESLKQAIKRQSSAAISGMDAAKAISSAQLERARRLRAESSPDALESERAMNDTLTRENNDLRAENAELRKDAVRYRWLRGDACTDRSARWMQWEVRQWLAPNWTCDLNRDALDGAIDEAMEGKP
jgi:cell division protein FtsB